MRLASVQVLMPTARAGEPLGTTACSAAGAPQPESIARTDAGPSPAPLDSQRLLDVMEPFVARSTDRPRHIYPQKMLVGISIHLHQEHLDVAQTRRGAPRPLGAVLLAPSR
jgi:hypothetical protein